MDEVRVGFGFLVGADESLENCMIGMASLALGGGYAKHANAHAGQQWNQNQ